MAAVAKRQLPAPKTQVPTVAAVTLDHSHTTRHDTTRVSSSGKHITRRGRKATWRRCRCEWRSWVLRDEYALPSKHLQLVCLSFLWFVRRVRGF